ncbi:MAG: hypothetical protein HON23_03425 [Rickettsiales bacterium]|jgi:uncharacterized membrane protein required for colicin V production|nr:hypothetical protein [Rickettsiales bacterium]
MEGFNNYDYFVIGFLLITTGFGFVRGLSGEFCSFLKIIIASALSLYSVMIVSDSFFDGKSGAVSSVALSIVPGVVFFFSNLVLGIFLFPVKGFIRVLIPFMLDRVLGVAMAFLKNIFILIIIHIILTVGVEMVSGKNLKWASKSKVAKFLTPVSEEVLDTGLIQGYIKDRVKGSKSDGKSNNAKDKDGSVIEGLKSKYGSLFDQGEAEDKGGTNDANDIVQPSDDKTESSQDIGGTLGRIKDLYDSLGDDDKDGVRDTVKDKVPNMDVDELKDLIDNLNN